MDGWMAGLVAWWPDGLMAWWMGRQLMGVLGLKSQHVSRQSLGALFALLRFYFRCNNRIAEKTRKTGKARNKSGKLVKKRPGRRKILSKQKANALKRGREKEERLSAFHFSLRAIVKRKVVRNIWAESMSAVRRKNARVAPVIFMPGKLLEFPL